jgi:hypothetical protein
MNGYDTFTGASGAVYGIYDANGITVREPTLVRSGAGFTRTAAMGDGFVVVYATEPEILRAQRYDATGLTLGDEFTVNQTNVGRVGYYDVAHLAGGGFVVVWNAGPITMPDSGEIYGQRYDAQGTAIGRQFMVNTTRQREQHRPRVAATANGGFVVVWNTRGADYYSNKVYAQLYASSGHKLGGELKLTLGNKSENAPVVGGLKKGGFVVAWTDDGPDTNFVDFSVRGRRFTSAGLPLGPEFLVAEQGEDASLTMLDHDRFLVAFESLGRYHGIHARLFGPNAINTEFFLSSYLLPYGGHYSPQAVQLSASTVFVTWGFYENTNFGGTKMLVESGLLRLPSTP